MQLCFVVMQHIPSLTKLHPFRHFRKMEFAIQHTWDSNPVDHDPIRISFTDGQSGLRMEVSGPFFNDPESPAGEPGIAFPGLWNYEGKRRIFPLSLCCVTAFVQRRSVVFLPL